MTNSVKMTRLTSIFIAVLQFVLAVVFSHVAEKNSTYEFYIYLGLSLLGIALLFILKIDTIRDQVIFFLIQIFYFTITGIFQAYFFDNAYIFFIFCLLIWIVNTAMSLRLLYVYQAALQAITATMYCFVFHFIARKELLTFIIVLGLVTWLSYRFSIIRDRNAQITLDHKQSYNDMIALADNQFEYAKQANNAKSAFLANMSHEIRTPINAIMGLDTMILRESKEPQTIEYARDIESSSEALLTLINDILDLSKIESGKMNIIPVEYNFATTISDVIKMIKFKANSKNLEVKLIIQEDIPSVLFGDDIRIKQILINLLNNAVKYTERGTVTLRISCDDILEKKAYIKFEVIDTGIGIKQQDLYKLFEEFSRIDEKRNRKIEGTGLGMSITTTLLNLMKSKLEVESEYGKGSIFSFTLRQRVIDNTPVGNIQESISKMGSYGISYKESFIAPDAKILVVDDNSTNRLVIKNLLKQTKIQIDEADSGQATLELIKDNAYDCILLDHMMPGMDGLETLAHIKSMPNHPNENTPVVALTANAISGAKEFYLDNGFDDFLSKPVSPEKLEKMVKGYIPEDKRLAAPEEPANESAPAIVVSEKLPNIEGINWNYAYVHLSDTASILDVVKVFYQTIDTEANYVLTMYDRLMADSNDQEALELYRIKVHALKSSSGIFGAFQLSGLAATLEYAARDAQLELIKDMTPHFIEILKDYKDKLSTMFDSSEEKKMITSENLATIINSITNLVATTAVFDVHSSDEELNFLGGFAYSEKLQKVFDKLSAAVMNFDMDNIESLANELREGLEDK